MTNIVSQQNRTNQNFLNEQVRMISLFLNQHYVIRLKEQSFLFRNQNRYSVE